MFLRNGDADLILDTDLWQYAFQQAAESLELGHLDMEAVRLPSAFKAPRVDLYNRQYRVGNKATMKEAKHECIRAGAELSFTLLLPSRSMPGANAALKPPTLEELVSIFEIVGARFGISPWGSARAYGRFNVLYIQVNSTTRRTLRTSNT